VATRAIRKHHQLLFLDAILKTRQCRSGTGGLIFIGGILDGGEQSGIMSQRLMIVDVFVTGCDGEYALGDEVTLLMNGEKGIAGIVNECVDAFGELKFLVKLPEQNGTGIGGEFATVKVDGDFFDFDRSGCLIGGFMVHCVLVVGG